MALSTQPAPPPDIVTSDGAPAGAPRGHDLRIATYNIHGGYGAWPARAVERIVAVIRELDADVIALQEVPLGGTRAPDVLAHLRDATGMHAVAGPTIDTPERRYGNAVLSRCPIRAARTLDLSFHQREPRGALDADIDCSAGPIRVVATHLGLSANERSAQVQRLLAAFDTGAMPVILMGDINEWFVRGRALQALTTRFRRAPAPRTFPTAWPVFSLDRIWIHPGELLVDVAVHRSMLARHASDHYPLVAQMRVEPGAGTPLAG